MSFQEDLTKLVHRYNKGKDEKSFTLAEYLRACLDAYDPSIAMDVHKIPRKA